MTWIISRIQRGRGGGQLFVYNCKRILVKTTNFPLNHGSLFTKLGIFLLDSCYCQWGIWNLARIRACLKTDRAHGTCRARARRSAHVILMPLACIWHTIHLLHWPKIVASECTSSLEVIFLLHFWVPICLKKKTIKIKPIIQNSLNLKHCTVEFFFKSHTLFCDFDHIWIFLPKSS